MHRIRGELPPPEAADEYDRAITGVTLDLLLLGLGPDAHAASLFPHSPQLQERSRLVTYGPAGLDPFVDRVTLTMPALLAARRIVFLMEGASKADAVEMAFFGEIGEHAPASLLRTGIAPIDVYLDPDGGRAARRLAQLARKQRRAATARRQAPAAGERLQHEHGVRDRDVLQVVLPRLERLEHPLERLAGRVAIAPRDRGQRVGDRGREVVATLQRRRQRLPPRPSVRARAGRASPRSARSATPASALPSPSVHSAYPRRVARRRAASP